MFPDYTERTSNMLLALLHKYGIEDIPKYDAAAGSWVSTQLRFQHDTAFILTRMRPCTLVTTAFLRPVCYCLAAARANRATRPEVERPDGPVWEVIRNNCTACHGIDDYAFYSLDKAGWSKLIGTNTSRGSRAIRSGSHSPARLAGAKFGPTRSLSQDLRPSRDHDLFLRSGSLPALNRACTHAMT